MSQTRSVYLDHAATTPMHPEAIEAMTAALSQVGNASSLHTAGRAARRRVEYDWKKQYGGSARRLPGAVTCAGGDGDRRRR